MDQAAKLKRKITRRWFIEQCGVGMGAFALNHLLASAGYAATQEADNPLAPKKPHFAPKAKSVIFLFMAGAPSHLEMFDYKPQLAKFDGTLPPRRIAEGLSRGVHQSEFEAARAEVQVREARPVRRGTVRAAAAHWRASSTTSRSSSRWSTDAFNHAPAQILMNTGSQQFGRPSMGAWVTYGLGSEAQDLPAFVVFSTGSKGPERRQLATGAAASCRRSIRACSSATAAIRCCTSRTRDGVDAEAAARLARRDQRS